MLDPEAIYFVTNRTLHGRLLLTPSHEVNNAIGAVLARAVERYEIKLYNFVFMSNHFHMIVQAPRGGLSSFMQYLGGEIARQVGAIVGWREAFWERRFSAEPILDDDALMQRMTYILGHGVKEGLVDRASHWPGLSALRLWLRRGQIAFRWRRRFCGVAHDRVRSADWQMREFVIKLSPLPAAEGLSEADLLQQIKRLTATAEDAARQTRLDKPALGCDAILSQDPHSRPQELNRTPRPWCHATSMAARAAYRALYLAFVEAYRYASSLFRMGNLNVEFPPHANLPQLPCGWRCKSGPLVQP